MGYMEMEKEKENSSEEPQPKWLGRLRRNPIVVTLVVAVVAITALNGILDFPQRAHDLYHFFFPVASPIQFNDLSKITVPRFGVTFSYPSDWDRQYAPENGDGAEFVDPDDNAVSITGYGSFGDRPLNTIFDAENEWKKLILELKNGRIVEVAASGTFSIGATGNYAVDGWRVVYQYVNDHGRSMTDMAKVAVADGREADLVMEAPTTEFGRYEQAFLQLSDKLYLTQCASCSGK